MRSRRALRYSSAGLFGAVGDEVCRATLRKAQGLFRERVRWTTALAWISCSAQTTGAQRSTSSSAQPVASSYHVPLPARHELASAQRCHGPYDAP